MNEHTVPYLLGEIARWPGARWALDAVEPRDLPEWHHRALFTAMRDLEQRGEGLHRQVGTILLHGREVTVEVRSTWPGLADRLVTQGVRHPEDLERTLAAYARDAPIVNVREFVAEVKRAAQARRLAEACAELHHRLTSDDDSTRERERVRRLLDDEVVAA